MIWRLVGSVKHYGWGQPASQSLIAGFPDAEGTYTDSSVPMAEIWFGTHINGPTEAETIGTSKERIPLTDLLRKHTSSAELPILFKILSVHKSLSLQLHPDERSAHELHRAQPDAFPDPHSKPEVSVALEPFSALCGLKSPSEFLAALGTDSPEGRVLRELVGPDAIGCLAEGRGTEDMRLQQFRDVITRLLRSEGSKASAELVAELLAAPDSVGAEAALVRRLIREHSATPSALAPLFMKTVCVPPGDMLPVLPGTPHSYTGGTCVEVMRASDNVIRAGLTPKHTDPELFLRLVRFDASPRGARAPAAFSTQGMRGTALVLDCDARFAVLSLQSAADGVIDIDALAAAAGDPSFASAPGAFFFLFVNEGVSVGIEAHEVSGPNVFLGINASGTVLPVQGSPRFPRAPFAVVAFGHACQGK